MPVCTAAALQRYELALAKLQKRSLLLVAALDGALCDLSLSLALACDFRLATADTCLPARPASQATGATQPYVPLPIWWLASLALHAGVLRAQKLLWRTQPVGTHELLDCHVVHALCPNVAALRAARLPVPPNVPLALLRRIVLQTFSVAGTDVIGLSLTRRLVPRPSVAPARCHLSYGSSTASRCTGPRRRGCSRCPPGSSSARCSSSSTAG